MLELNKVKKIYQTKSGKVTALNGVNITFPQNGMIFITGKSGCGKTTLLNVIGGLDSIDEGEISLLGKSFNDFTAEEYDSYRNTFIGFVFQEYNLLNEYTVEKNIKIAMELQGQRSDENEFNNLLETVEISELKNRKPNELSGGQRQRVAIARALVKKPRIIIADEPTGALDSNTGIQVLDILKKLSKEKLIIVVSHDNEFAEKYADRIIRLVDGNIVEDVSFSENEIEENVKEQEDTLIVKNGADLNEKEKNLLASAVKNKKKIEIIEKLSYREKFPTKEVKSVVSSTPVKFRKSQMKFKSAFFLGLKSLGVKPLRLIFTILLSAIAFSVFGLFDTIANFSTVNVISHQLKKSESPTVVLAGKYVANSDLGDVHGVRITDKKLKQIENETGYSIKGIYQLETNTNGTTRTYTINELPTSLPSLGKNYYTSQITGLIEFSESEISSTGKLGKSGYTLVEGRYPSIDTMLSENVCEVAISTYLADCIVYYLDGKPLGEKPIAINSDLIDSIITIAGNHYKIVGLINCGEIPSKYFPLTRTASSIAMSNLANDFKSYINSGAYKCLFMPDGYREYLHNTINKGVSIFFGGDANWNVRNGTNTSSANKYFYSANDFNSGNSLRFIGNADTPLKNDEVLIHINNIDLLFKSEIANLEENRSTYKANYNMITKSNAKQSEIQVGFNNIKEIFSIKGESDLKTIAITKTELKSDNKITIENVKVVGVYYGIDSNAYEYTYRFALNEKLMSEFNIFTEQGDYEKIFLSPKNNVFGTKKIAQYMTASSGFSLDWYGNPVINTISENEYTIRQSADLFLYASIILALFSVFMFFNYISTSIVNKRPTIGVLRCLGSNSKNIFTIFTLESIVMAIINGLLATAITALACIFVNMYIINVMNIGVAFAIFGIRQFIIIFSISLLTAIISSVFPIIKISKEKPVDLIRKP